MWSRLGGGRRQQRDHALTPLAAVGDPLHLRRDRSHPPPSPRRPTKTPTEHAVDAGRVGHLLGSGDRYGAEQQRGVQPLHARGRRPLRQEDGRREPSGTPTQNKFYVFPSSGQLQPPVSTATASLTDSMHLTWSFSSSFARVELTGGTTTRSVARTRDAAGNFTARRAPPTWWRPAAPRLTFYWDVTPPTMTLLNAVLRSAPGRGRRCSLWPRAINARRAVCAGVSRVEVPALQQFRNAFWDGREPATGTCSPLPRRDQSATLRSEGTRTGVVGAPTTDDL